MARTTAYTQFIALPPERLWAVLADPVRWPEWNPAVASVRLREAPGVGVRGDYLPSGRANAAVHGRLARAFTITSFVPGRELVVQQPEPAGVMRISWTLTPCPGGTELVQRIGLVGACAPIFWFVIGGRLQAHARVGFARLARLAGIAPADGALTVVIAGGSGALGRNIAADLTCRGLRVRILTRRRDPELPFEQVEWDGRSVGDWAGALRNSGPTAVINLAGKLVDCRPTEANVVELRRSRVDPTAALVAASATLDRPIDHWIQASTTAIWSDAGEMRCTETTPLPQGLPQMTGVARPWEQAFEGANAEHHTILRTSIVLDSDSPALQRLCDLTRAGLGGRVGPGDQWFSWIHIEDWLALIRAALGLDPEVRLPDGILVAATDYPVRNRDLMIVLRRHLHRPPAPPTPAPLLKLGAVILRTDPALGLTGRHATSEVLPHTGFRFRYPTLDEALGNLLPH
ncbi:DUF1731 domain-containing protein [Nocardia jiangxiensis]|uniref:DUF1731 domain-containing protein n=1 Tax=Nocardia jiangxiensis TaxID=282685 RepID=UPI0002D9897C|nr:DUF1731 domain-containing protein [Nocardia jiangxiensis]